MPDYSSFLDGMPNTAFTSTVNPDEPYKLSDVTIRAGILNQDVYYEERAAYIVEGSPALLPDGESFNEGQLLVFKSGAAISLRAAASSAVRVMLLGGERMDGRRHIWWNFVSSSKDRIEQAKKDWKLGRFAPVPDETEFIPLPKSGSFVVRYP
jgi:redox-sensitive bicupin YhaK (pirin superfamily)